MGEGEMTLYKPSDGQSYDLAGQLSEVRAALHKLRVVGGKLRTNLHYSFTLNPQEWHEPSFTQLMDEWEKLERETYDLAFPKSTSMTNDAVAMNESASQGLQKASPEGEGRDMPWTPEVEAFRAEMMRRFSNKLSMEEVADFSYWSALRQSAAPSGGAAQGKGREMLQWFHENAPISYSKVRPIDVINYLQSQIDRVAQESKTGAVTEPR